MSLQDYPYRKSVKEWGSKARKARPQRRLTMKQDTRQQAELISDICDTCEQPIKSGELVLESTDPLCPIVFHYGECAGPPPATEEPVTMSEVEW